MRPLPSLLSLSFALVVAPRPLPAEPRADGPISLTASDGTGLVLAALDVRAVVEDPLAFTELHLTFDNPEDRTLEGQFRITLPRGASVSRFAMRTEAGWQEGEVVELQAARRAYEDFLHRRQDPALLEQAAGNEFSARVFPIPARAQKQLILSYSQELPGAEEAYVLPLAGLPRLGRLDVRILDRTATPPRVVEDHRQAFTPDRDVEVRPARGAGRLGVRDGDLAVVRIRPISDSADDKLSSLLLLVDTSASRALGFEESLALVRELVAALRGVAGDATPLAVVAFDQTAELVHDGKAKDFGDAALARLRSRAALGASSLEAALTFARGHLAGAKAGHRRLAVLGDGVVTAGADDAGALRELVRGLAGVGVERLDAVAVGGIRDERLLAALTTAGLARDGAVLDGKLGARELVRRLGRATRSGIAVSAAGAGWVWPERLDGVQAGDDVLVFASVPRQHPLRLTVGATTFAPAPGALGPSDPRLLARAAGRARIARLLAARDALAPGETAKAEELRREIVSLSTRERVLSPFTALLVLESEEDYRRFQLSRRALGDILTVGEDGITVLDRRVTALPPARVEPAAGEELRRAREATQKRLTTKLDAPEHAAPIAKEEAKTADLLDAAGEPPAATADLRAAGDLAEISAGRGAAGAAGTAAPAGSGAAPDVARPAPASPPPPVAPHNVQAVESTPAPLAAPERRARRPASAGAPSASDVDSAEPPQAAPYTGRFAEVMALLDRGDTTRARELATRWRALEPGDVLALVALGEACERGNKLDDAARAYGSLIDLFPNRADLRRFAGERLERVKTAGALRLAVDTYRKAVAQRPDHPASHRLLAFALLRIGEPAQAFTTLAQGLARGYPDGRFAGAAEILAEDLGLIAAAWTRAEPARAAEIARLAQEAGGRLEAEPSLRFVLNWETDANDVDFHIYDGKGNHAYYEHMELASGGRLYADVTTGYGPECFTIRGRARAFPYRLKAHYYSRGPMGYGMGKLEVVHHDGRGTLRFEERPFVVMQDQAYVDLGVVAQ